jgi:enoyl-CoA hydratase/carnithine racemase
VAPTTSRARALEIILGGDGVDAATAERWGYVNRTLPDGELRPFVDAFAARLARLSPGAIGRAKRAVDVAVGDPTPGLRVEDQLFRQCLGDREAPDAMARFMAAGGQTREVEVVGFPDGL